MSFLKKIRNLLFIFVILGAATAYLDYYRMTIGEVPLFCKKSYNPRTKIEEFRGIFYIAERTVKNSTKETLNLSSNVKYRFLTKTLKIKQKHPKDHYDFILYVTPSIECPSPSSLYYMGEEKIYIDCIHKIEVKEKKSKEKIELKDYLAKNPESIEDIIKELSLTGIVNDKAEKYIDKKDSFIVGHLTVYRCINESKSIYLTNSMEMVDDYCTIKNDSIDQG